MDMHYMHQIKYFILKYTIGKRCLSQNNIVFPTSLTYLISSGKTKQTQQQKWHTKQLLTKMMLLKKFETDIFTLIPGKFDKRKFQSTNDDALWDEKIILIF